MALTNISFLISDANFASEDLLIGLPVLKHLEIDSRTLLEGNRAHIDGVECSSIPPPEASNTCGSLGRLMIARMERAASNDDTPHSDDDDVTADSDEDDATSTSPQKDGQTNTAVRSLDPNRPRSNYYSNRFDEDLFPAPNLIELDGPAKTKQE